MYLFQVFSVFILLLHAYTLATPITSTTLYSQTEKRIDCDEVLGDSSSYVGLCNNKWHNLKDLLKPTQMQVGYAWIKYKLDKDFTSKDKAQEVFDEESIPAVIGPDNKYYIVDDHHTLSALDYSGYVDVSVTLNIICDKRDVSDITRFWQELDDGHLAYFGAHPHDSPDELPIRISSDKFPTRFEFTKSTKVFSDDPWRSLAGYSRKVQNVSQMQMCPDSSKYCNRCMYRGCDDGSQEYGPGFPYFEFSWSYFMLESTYFESHYWPSSSSLATFTQAYESLPHVYDVDEIDSSNWFDIAELIIPLCRSSQASSYLLPTDIYEGSGKLPGFVEGNEQLPNDPDCDSPSCK